MDYHLGELGKAVWKKRLAEQRKRCGKRQKEITEVGLDGSQVSRFETGDESALRSWFKLGHAAKYAAAVGVDLPTLERWFAEARDTAPKRFEWHAAFPGVAIEDVRVSPGLKVSGLDPAPTDVASLVDALVGACGSNKKVKVRVAPARGAGRRTLEEWLGGSGLPETVTIGGPERTHSGHKPPWMVLPALDTEGDVKLVDVEILPWDAAAIGTLADRLVALEALSLEARRRVARVLDQLQTAHLAVGPSTAIELVASAARTTADSDDVVAALADAQWALVQKAADGLDRTDRRWLYRFWAERRLDCVGQAWLAPTRDEAVASMARVCACAGAALPDRAAIRTRLRALQATGGAKKGAIEELDQLLALPDPGAVVDAMVAAGLLMDGPRWLQAADPQLAEAFAAIELRERMKDIAADPHLAWALDPSWRPLLGRLGGLNADPLPVVERWRTMPLAARVEGALALVFLFARGPTPRKELAPVVREVQAAAIWAYLATPGPHDLLQVQLTFALGGAVMRELGAAFQMLSAYWAADLGFFEGDTMVELASRVPEDIRSGLTPRGGGPLAGIMQRNGDLPRERYDEIVFLCLAPWQTPMIDDPGGNPWWLANSVASMCVRPLPDAGAVLELAHRNGHRRALAVLAGSEPVEEPPGEPEGRLEWEPNGEGYTVRTLPRRRDPWRNLGWEVRCRWVGRAGAAVVTEARFIELVTERREDEQLEPLLDAAKRVGKAVVSRVLRSLSAPEPDDLAWMPQRPWLLRSVDNARIAVQLGAAAGAGAALVEVDDAVRALLSSCRPTIDDNAWESPPRARMFAGEKVDGDAVAEQLARVRGLARLPAGQSPAWLAHATQLVADAMSWESVRHEIAVALANLENRSALRGRALRGSGWTLPEGVLADLDLAFRRVALDALNPGPSLAFLAQHPVPEDDGCAFLSRLRERGLTRASRFELPDDGSWFPMNGHAGGGAMARPNVRRPRWLEKRAAELDALRELRDSPRGTAVRRSIEVLSWMCPTLAGERLHRADLPEGLWTWLGEVADVWPAFSPARVVAEAIERSVRLSAASELIARRDADFIGALWGPEVDEESGDAREEARSLVEERMKSDAALRTAVWRHANSYNAQYRAFSVERATGSPSRWVHEEEERRPFTAHDFFNFVARRLRSGSRVLVPQVRTLCEHLLELPLAVATPTEPDAPIVTLPATTHPPEVWETVIELVKLTPEGRSALAAAWWRETETPVPGATVEQLVGYLRAWADADDLAAPVRRHDIHRCWLLSCAEDLLDCATVELERVEPGVLRVVLRERLATIAGETIVPWITEQLDACSPAELEARAGWLWVRWAEVQPREAWAWLQRRSDEDVLDLTLTSLAQYGVVLVEGVVPSARRWLVQRITEQAELARERSAP